MPTTIAPPAANTAVVTGLHKAIPLEQVRAAVSRHSLIDKDADIAVYHIDEFAERAFMIDGKLLGDPVDYLPASTIEALRGDQTVRAMFDELLANVDTIIAEMVRDADTVTQKRWFARQIVRRGDGLTG